DRPPRAYRNRDYDWWLGVLGEWDVEATPDMEHVTIAVSGAHGGRTIDFRELAREGITLLGMTEAFKNGSMTFAPGLAENITRGYRHSLALLDAADGYIERYGVALPEEPEARQIPPDPECVKQPITELDLAATGINTSLWATGFRTDFSWLDVDAFDAEGKPQHLRGVSSEPGIYLLGLPWQSCRGYSSIWGVWHDAKHIADHISKQRKYDSYHVSARQRTEVVQ